MAEGSVANPGPTATAPLKGLAVEATFSAHVPEPDAENCQRFVMMGQK